MSMLSGFLFHQLLTTPAPPAADPPSDRAVSSGRVALFAALTAAHAELLGTTAQAGLVVAWERPAGQRRIRVVFGGNPRFPPASPAGKPMGVMYPPGSTARALDSAALIREWHDVPVWTRCTGHPDSLWADSQGTAPGRGCFEDYVAHLPGEFVWLVHAQPLSAAAVDAELAGLEVQLPRLRARENSEPDRIALRRGEFRYRELARARSPGMWAVHILVGAPTEHAVARAAGLLCSAADLDDLPYTLAPHPDNGSLPTVWETTIDAGGFGSPFTASTELLAALARPPTRELPGIRVVEPVSFDVTPEHDGDIDLGEILDNTDGRVGRFLVGRDTLNRHGFVAGATGSGKSQTVRHLLAGLHKIAVPWLVIEPAKAEYAGMAGRINAPVTVIRPGDPDAVPVGLNPLEPEPGFPLQTHIDLVRALFLAAFDAVEPFPQVLAHALTRCYTDLGWDTVIGDTCLGTITPRYPNLTDLQSAALSVVEGIGYGREITDNVRGFIDVRLSSLRLGTPGRFFQGGYRLDLARLLRTNAVLEIEDIGNDADKAFFIGVVLIRIFEHLRVHHSNDCGELTHVLVVEEAHRLLRRAEPGTPAAHAVELFAALLAEIRAYGAGIIVAEQIPTKISPDIVKNTALKIVHRLPATEDRDFVGATMNLDPTGSRHVVSLPPGRAIVFTDGMDRPLRIDIPLGQAREARMATTIIALSPEPDQPPLLLRELHHAHRLADDPHLTLWTELLLLAHLVGRPSPDPAPGWLTHLITTYPPPILLEAIGFRIRTSIDNRYTGLTAYFQPEHLADHLASTAINVMNGAGKPCSGDETCWQAGRYRWTDVEAALREPQPHAEQPHPDTGKWERRGLVLAGTTPADQLDALHRHPDTWTDRRIVTGFDDQTLLAVTISRLSRAGTAEARFREASRHLRLNTLWPLALVDTDDGIAEELR
ncbi:ATP-binding protein [Nocardia sp. NPDC046473]|uniref:ATP-binding protein n=1 Tax=Nocardia sp. NPDC046473 TaxID=3155733 RepID=UPI0033C34150